MEIQTYHLLNVEGILKSFNISKRISFDEIQDIKNSLPEDCVTRFEQKELLKDKLIEHTNEYVKDNPIPGLIKNEKETTNTQNKKQKHLIINKNFDKVKHDAKDFAKQLKSNKKYKKDELLFFIISLIDELRLTEDDFEDFHERLDNEEDFKKDEDDEQDEENLDNSD